MKGDYNTYKTEWTSGVEKEKASAAAQKAYIEANEKAESCLKTINPLRIKAASNYAQYQYEVKKNVYKACQIAKMSFDDALVDFD